MHLFVVASPLQALNAFEARAHLDIPVAACELFVIHPVGRTAEVESHLRSAVECGSWSRIHDVPRRTLPKLRWARRQINRGRGPTYIGDSRSPLMRHLANTRCEERAVLLDDGNATLLVNEHRRAQSTGADPDSAWLGGRRVSRARRLLEPLTGLKAHDLPSVTFFTIYDIEPTAGDEVIRHRYENLRTAFDRPDVGPPIMVGSNAADLGLIPLDDYIETVDRVRRITSGRAVYVPHRRESDQTLAQIGGECGLSVRRLDTPIELSVLREWRPSEVYGLMSSALDTLAVLLEGTPITAFRPAPERFIPAARSGLSLVYSQLERRSGVDVVDIDGA